MSSEMRINGDPARQAIASLRGYAYQLYESALAWISLKEDEVLFLEVAEDYAIATNDALQAVQVKDTGASITLNSKEVIDTINSFFKLTTTNPDKNVSIRHLTTASIGLEKEKADRIEGKAGLSYWASARDSADVEPLRKRLLELNLSKEAKRFLNNSSSDEMRIGLVKRIEWLGGAKDLTSLRKTLANTLVYIGQRKNVASSACDGLVDPLVARVLNVALTNGSRGLEKADFVRFFDDSSRVSLPVSAVENMMLAIKPASGSAPQAFASSISILRPVATIDPTKLAARSGLVGAIQSVMRRAQVAWLYGAAGTGKSSLSKVIAHLADKRWHSVQLRSLKPLDTAEALHRASSQMAIEYPGGVVLDDLEPLSTSAPKEAFVNLVETARRTSTRLLITSNYTPPNGIFDRLEVPPEVAIKVGNLTEEELAAFVRSMGGNPRFWARYVHLATGGGQPLLTDAMVRGLRSRDWPSQELEQLSAILDRDADIEEVRSEARRRLFTELARDESLLLVRLSLVLGTFNRKIGMYLAGLDPAIEMPGMAFDNLVGAWIEAESEGRFRLSSLVSNAGAHVLGPETNEKLHHALADYYTKELRLEANRFDDMVLHGLVGKNNQALTLASLAVISAAPEDLSLIAQHSSNLSALRTDQPLYPSDPTVSLYLRISQVLMLITEKKTDLFREAWSAFERESEDERLGSAKVATQAMAYTKAMSLPGLIDVVVDLPQFALTTAQHARNANILYPVPTSETVGSPTSSDEHVQFMFAFQISNVSDFQTLRRTLASLISKAKPKREYLLKAFQTEFFEEALVIASPWIKALEDGRLVNEELAAAYLSLARELATADESEFATAAFVTAAVIWDEDLNNQEKALEYLGEALSLLGESQSRARAASKVLLHLGEYERQLDVGMPISESFAGSATETGHFLRELAIGNSRLGRHRIARELYLNAHERIVADPSKRFTPLAAGLLADAAVEAHWDGDSHLAIKLFSKALIAAETLNPEDGLRSAATIRLIAHSIVWLLFQITKRVKEASAHEMVPGANSNPMPHKNLDGAADLPFDCAWYVLADIEAAIDGDCGVIEKLSSTSWDSRAILANEVNFYFKIALSAERRLSTKDYLLRKPRAIDAYIYCEKNAAELMSDSLSASPRKRLPQLEQEQFSEHLGRFANGIMSFALRLAFQKTPQAAVDFMIAAHSSPRPLITKSVLDAFLEGRTSPSADEASIAGSVGCIATNVASNIAISVRDLTLLCVRAFELLNGEYCEETTVARFVAWALHRWKVAVVDQAFQLSSPSLAQQSLAEYEQRAGERIADLADLILTVAPFVKVNLGQAYLQRLAATKRQ